MGYIVFLFGIVVTIFALLIVGVFMGMFAGGMGILVICFAAAILGWGVIKIVRYYRVKRDWPKAKVIHFKKD